jgi:ribosomal protein L11 methyltransferase
MLDLFPEGFEEAERGDELEFAAYTGAAGEERARADFGSVLASEVPADWEERWKRFHCPVEIGGLWVGPPWEEAPDGVPAITIDPGRAFGTGGHPTTRLCLELLSALARGSLLDVGCGSGVLSIAAAKLGFSPVTAVDHDAAAVDATSRNAAANAVALDVRRLDARVDQLPPARVALTNISKQIVAEVAPRLTCELLVTSGYFEPHVPRLERFRRIERRTLDGWAADLHAPE